MISKQNGFSLLEVLISFVLLVVGVMGLIKLQVYVDKKSEYAANSIQALYAAESKLEYFRTRSIDGEDGTIKFKTIVAQATPEVINGYKVSWNVIDSMPIVVSGANVTTLKEINIKAEWSDRWNEVQEVTLQTMISRYSEFY
ncbi:prepilin-type N-terminal cleavage/methylation domain-containing protein [Aliivibrio logei]|uniref:type IV pilus modification PilV family protein n=1 Tax=Aliivibrio logei TaxID=688 RepID=UPI0035C89415